MYCSHCGKELRQGAKFCPYCGKQQRQSQVGQPETAPTREAEVSSPAAPVEPAAPKGGKMERRKRILLLCLAAVVIVAGVLVWRMRERNAAYQAQMSTAVRFLSEENYEEAMLAFNAAIEIDPKRPEAYLGIGDVYAAQGDFISAASAYAKALQVDDHSVDAYLKSAANCLEQGDEEGAIRILRAGYEKTKDDRLILWADTISNTHGESSLSGLVSEYVSGGGTAALPGARVRLYVNLNGEPRLLRADTSDDSGQFFLDDLPAGEYVLHVDAIGHIGIQTVYTLGENEAGYTEVFLMIPRTEGMYAGERGTLYARVTNALNGEAVEDAQVRLYRGWNSQGGESVGAAVTTDAYGEIRIEGLEYGYYTAEVSGGDYITACHNVAVVPEEFYAQWDLPVSPTLKEGETRIVLTWGEFPYDLDSHLISDQFHIAYWNLDYRDDLGRHRANLDLDDTDSYGPETVTIYNGVDGVYTYAVRDYTNGGDTSSTALAASGATVRVYQEEGLVATYHVPTRGVGFVWTVFRIHQNGTIETVNTVDGVEID